MFIIWASSVGEDAVKATAPDLDRAKEIVARLVKSNDRVECWEMGKSETTLYSSIRMAGDIEHTVRTNWS